MMKQSIGLILLMLAPALGAQPATLYDNAAIITGDGGYIDSGAVLVEDGRISAIGPSGSLTLPAGGERVDLTGRILMPAMLDAHAHLGYQSGEGWGAQYYSRDNLLANLQQYAWYGFAAVFSAGSDPEELALALQAEQAEQVEAGAGELAGAARLLFAAGMGPPGQGPNDAFLVETAQVRQRTGMTLLRGIDSPVNAIMQARDVADKGIPFIKIWVDDRGGSQQKLSPDHYLPLLAETMRQRLKVFVHQQSAADMLPLLAAGASGFLHGRLGPDLGPEIARATARARAFVVPNLGLGELRGETIGQDPFLQAVLPASTSARLARASGNRQSNARSNPGRDAELAASLGHLLEAGADIVLGTDAGALPDHPFGYTGHRELEIYVRLGMTPMQALVAATGKAAEHLDQRDLGVLEAGRRASFVVLSANPLEDIRNTRAIEAVYLNGQSVPREAIASRLQQ